MGKNRDIQFIKPCRLITEEHRLLTPEYTRNAFFHGVAVLINLDNSSIQRMEELPENPNIKDVEAVGLLPLVKILQAGAVGLNAIGVNEMPDCRVVTAKFAYERFCQKFWPGHVDDIDATDRNYDKNSTDRKVSFKDLKDVDRCIYGLSYVSMLQIRNIKRTYKNISPERQFEIYMFSVVTLLDLVGAFEIEVAKYAFWALKSSEINQLPERIKIRRQDIQENFVKGSTNLKKCREKSFGAAMDIFWLNSSNLSEDFNQSINFDGKELKIDNWVGTNDHKLYRISRDIHSIYHEGSNMKRLAVTREGFLTSTSYWKYVDNTSHEIMRYRNANSYQSIDGILERIDVAVEHVEQELIKSFENKNVVVKST